MNDKVSNGRMAENEVFFRRMNQRVQKRIESVNQIAEEEGTEPINIDGDMPLFFFCECSDENCKERIRISLNDYNKIHEKPNAFTIVCGHEAQNIEIIASKSDEYCVVTKFVAVPGSATRLNKTDLDNS